ELDPARRSTDSTIAQLAAIIAKGKEGSEHSSGQKAGEINKYNDILEDTKSLQIAAEDKTVHDGFPIVDSEEKLIGIITYGDIVKALARGERSRTVAK